MPKPVSIQDILKKPGQRFLTITKDAVNVESRTVSLAFSSEEPVLQWFGYEILDHSPGACDLSRLNDGAPLMDNHRCLIGKVEAATIDGDRKGRATVRFSKSAKAEEMLRDVADEIRTKTSVGYERLEMVLEKTDGEMPTYRVTKWRAYEISLADIPADNTVGVGRTMEIPNNQSPNQGERIMPPVIQTDPAGEQRPIDVNAERSAAVTAERTRVSEISAIATQFTDRIPEIGAMREKAMNEGWDVVKFRTAVMDAMPNAKKIENPNPNLGMSQSDIRSYSIVKAIRQIALGQKLDGIEAEASREYAKLSRREAPANGFIVPNDVIVAHRAERALSTASASAGGFLVGTDVLGNELIELPRNKMKVVALGARILSGLVGNVAIPKVAGGATTYWLAPGVGVQRSDQSFGQVGMTPHRLVAATAYDKELMNQTSLSVEDFVREDIDKVTQLEKDRAAINGSGADGQPTGILNLPTGLLTVTFGAAATFAKMVEFETNVATANTDSGSLAYLTTPGVRGKLKTVQMAANLPFIWADGKVNGYPAEATNQVPLNKVIFGNWADMIIGEWAGRDVVVDPYSLSLNGQISVVVTEWCDIAARHAASFCASTDSGAQ